MSRYIGPKLKLARREGVNLQLKSCCRTLDSKCKAKSKPGQHGKRPNTRYSSYNVRFREKQKLKRLYGLTERQFLGYVKRAIKKGDTIGTTLLQTLETRLDNIVYRLRFSTTRAEARQVVSHKLILVNGAVINIPSYTVKPNDKIQIRGKDSAITRASRAIIINKGQEIPCWLDISKDGLSGTFKAVPKRNDIPDFINDQLVLEFYSGSA